MADTAEDVKRKLSAQIDAAKEKLDLLKRDIAGMHEEDMAALSQRRSEIGQRLDQQRSRAQQLQEKITSWKNEKKAHTLEAIAAWQERQELEKLEKRAERAADYAADMVTIAANDFEEAEQAVCEAISARLEASQAFTSASPA
jgi:FtsZ-binding cell division protein ZapB